MIKRSNSPVDSNEQPSDGELDGVTSDEKRFIDSLRPRKLKEYIGQKDLKSNLDVFITAAQKRSEPMEHVLLHGPAGLGKTTLATIIAREMGVTIKTTSGPALERQGDIAAILSNLQKHDILFIDEIHRLRPAVEEVLYTAMEDFGIDIVLGKGPSARAMRLNLQPFTLIGATTRMSLLSSPLRDRFGHVFKLDFYSTEEICEIILRSAAILQCEINKDAALRLAKCSRQTPRIANRLLRRTRDFAEVNDIPVISIEIADNALSSLGVDKLGLDDMDRNILSTMVDKFQGGPIGLNTLAAAVSEDEQTIEEVYEPFLLKLGFLDRTPRGRCVTKRGYGHLGVEFVADTIKKVAQDELL